MVNISHYVYIGYLACACTKSGLVNSLESMAWDYEPHGEGGGSGKNGYYEVSHAMRVDHLSAVTSQSSGVLSLSRLLMRRSRLCYQPASYVAFSLSLEM